MDISKVDGWLFRAGIGRERVIFGRECDTEKIGAYRLERKVEDRPLIAGSQMHGRSVTAIFSTVEMVSSRTEFFLRHGEDLKRMSGVYGPRL